MAMSLTDAAAAVSAVGPALVAALDNPAVKAVFDGLAQANSLCLLETTWSAGYSPSTYLAQSDGAGGGQHVVIPASTLVNLGFISRHLDDVVAQSDGWLGKNAIHADIPRGFILALCEAAGRSDHTAEAIRDNRTTALLRRQANTSQPLTKIELDARCVLTAHPLVYTMCSISKIAFRIQFRSIKQQGGGIAGYDFFFKLKSCHALAPHPWVEYFDQAAAAADGLGDRRGSVATVEVGDLSEMMTHLTSGAQNRLTASMAGNSQASAVLGSLLSPASAATVSDPAQLRTLNEAVPGILSTRSTASASAQAGTTALDAIRRIVAMNNA